MSEDGRSPVVIDLGCGSSKISGSIGVDCARLPGVDVVWDLRRRPYPFGDQSARRIICRHCLEHFDRDDSLGLLAEAHRILSPGGLLAITLPHAFSVGANLDPTHRSYWGFRSFDYFSPRHPNVYYAGAGFAFDVINRRTEINLWYDWRRLNRPQRGVNRVLTRLFDVLLRHSATLPDLAVKVLPIYYADVIVELEKPRS